MRARLWGKRVMSGAQQCCVHVVVDTTQQACCCRAHVFSNWQLFLHVVWFCVHLYARMLRAVVFFFLVFHFSCVHQHNMKSVQHSKTSKHRPALLLPTKHHTFLGVQNIKKPQTSKKHTGALISSSPLLSQSLRSSTAMSRTDRLFSSAAPRFATAAAERFIAAARCCTRR